ncbi:MAG: (2Fe-2S)-binding protein [Opitutaceae bacterium]|nr:(2Fe-2S)-binding protein [Opitutaceae bacterium]
MPEKLSFTLNGQPVSVEVDGDRKLLWVLRTDLALTGTKYSCGKGLCGTCTVLVDNVPQRSCMLRAGSVRGKEVTTIEGFEKDGELHPLQKAFIDHDALQCGFCTPGMILTAHGVLRRNPAATREQIVQGMERNLCRCGAHPRILDAIEQARDTLAGKPTAPAR